MTTASAIRQVLSEALEQNPAVVLLGEAVGRAGGTADTTQGLAERFGADRVRDLPIADRGTVGMALGIALAGGRPVVELADTSRLPAVLEVLVEAAEIAARTEFDVPLVVRVPYGTEAAGLDRPVGPFLTQLQGLSVVVGSNPAQASGLLRAALAARHPVVLLEPRALYRKVGDAGPAVELGTAVVVRSGTHVTLASWGTGVSAAVDASDALAAEGVHAGVVDLVSLSPLDRATLGAELRTTGRLVVAHDSEPELASAVRLVALDEAFLYLESPLAQSPASPAALASAARQAVDY